MISVIYRKIVYLYFTQIFNPYTGAQISEIVSTMGKHNDRNIMLLPQFTQQEKNEGGRDI